MAGRKFSSILVLLLASSAIANDSPHVNISSKIGACANFSKFEVNLQDNIPIVSFDLKITKPISECGCKSLLGAFTVFSLTDNYKSQLLSGKVALMNSERKALPLSAEKNLVKSGRLEIHFSCALPD